jgi:archaellum component FlaG (FlaF/FlaG flagellin family)
MAGLGRKVFTAGEVLTAANVNGYLMDQTVMVFAGTAARSSAIATASEGMVSYLSDTNAIQYYDGAAWTNLVDTSTFITASSTATLTNKTINTSQLQTTVNTVAATATTYAATVADRNELIYSLATAAMTVTVPDVFNIGDRIDLVRDGAGTVIVAAGTGVTSWAGAGTAGTAVTFKIDQQYNGATVMKVAANSYRVIGKITV